jgi:hypothetical protein
MPRDCGRVRFTQVLWKREDIRFVICMREGADLSAEVVDNSGDRVRAINGRRLLTLGDRRGKDTRTSHTSASASATATYHIYIH